MANAEQAFQVTLQNEDRLVFCLNDASGKPCKGAALRQLRRALYRYLSKAG